MKRMLGTLLVAVLLFVAAGCGKQPEMPEAPAEPESALADTEASSVPASEPEDTGGSGEAMQESEAEEGSRILIAYFTWAENTYVADPASVDVDATTSASVLMPGNVGLLAEWIAEETDGDMFAIVTEEAYSSDYDICLERAIEEHDSGARPAIAGDIQHIEDYEIVFLGFPNWWYSCPMAILTFIEEYDLSGKTIVPFCSHGTGGFAASLRDIGAALPDDCVVLEEFGAYRPEVADSKDELLAWLAGLGLTY